jgi:hypothetical protein
VFDKDFVDRLASDLSDNLIPLKLLIEDDRTRLAETSSDFISILFQSEIACLASDIWNSLIPLKLLIDDNQTKLAKKSSDLKLDLFQPEIKTQMILNSEQLLMNLDFKTYCVPKRIFDSIDQHPNRAMLNIPTIETEPLEDGWEKKNGNEIEVKELNFLSDE